MKLSEGLPIPINHRPVSGRARTDRIAIVMGHMHSDGTGDLGLTVKLARQLSEELPALGVDILFSSGPQFRALRPYLTDMDPDDNIHEEGPRRWMCVTDRARQVSEYQLAVFSHLNGNNDIPVDMTAKINLLVGEYDVGHEFHRRTPFGHRRDWPEPKPPDAQAHRQRATSYRGLHSLEPDRLHPDRSGRLYALIQTGFGAGSWGIHIDKKPREPTNGTQYQDLVDRLGLSRLLPEETLWQRRGFLYQREDGIIDALGPVLESLDGPSTVFDLSQKGHWAPWWREYNRRVLPKGHVHAWIEENDVRWSIPKESAGQPSCFVHLRPVSNQDYLALLASSDLPVFTSGDTTITDAIDHDLPVIYTSPRFKHSIPTAFRRLAMTWLPIGRAEDVAACFSPTSRGYRGRHPSIATSEQTRDAYRALYRRLRTEWRFAENLADEIRELI